MASFTLKFITNLQLVHIIHIINMQPVFYSLSPQSCLCMGAHHTHTNIHNTHTCAPLHMHAHTLNTLTNKQVCTKSTNTHVKVSNDQADVQRFEPHLGHNWLSCGMFLVKSRHFGLPLAQITMAKFAIFQNGWLGRYTNVEYLQSLY